MGVKFGPAADIDWPVLRWYLVLILVAFAALTGRLFWLQVMHGDAHRLASLNNIIRGTVIPGPRGDIYDRAGKPLAKSVNVYGLLYVPPSNIDEYLPQAAERRDLDAAGMAYPYLNSESGRSLREIQLLAAHLGITYVELMERIEAERRRLYGFQPLVLADELTQEQVIYIEEHKDSFPGTMIEQYSFKRSYPLGEMAAHLVGYVGQLSDSDPQSIQELGYGPREKVGKEGVERSYERLLHGVAGRRDIELSGQRSRDDDAGEARVIESVANEEPPQKGTDIYLTVNKELQAKVTRLLGGRPGAIIVSCLAEGYEGEILALASSPSYDPNRFTERGYYTSLIQYADGSENKSRPLLNRACRNAFPPGSTFKIVTATAALQEGVVVPGSSFTCQGFIEIGRYKQRFHCHNRNGHGRLTFVEGISESCDVVFYRLGERLIEICDAPATIKQYAQHFGYGQLLGINLPGEVRGLLPDKEWKREHYAGERYNEIDRSWFSGDTLNYMIGQGYLTSTPLQVLWSNNLVAWQGWWYQPRLLTGKKVAGQVVKVDQQGTPLRRDEQGRYTIADTEHADQRPLSTSVLQTVREGMRLAVVDGTCKQLNLDGMSVCAKSGTAETGIAGEEDHAWVCGFYPMNEPRYGYVVFFQNGGNSSETAVPTARSLLQYMRDNPPVSE